MGGQRGRRDLKQGAVPDPGEKRRLNTEGTEGSAHSSLSHSNLAAMAGGVVRGFGAVAAELVCTATRKIVVVV